MLVIITIGLLLPRGWIQIVLHVQCCTVALHYRNLNISQTSENCSCYMDPYFLRSPPLKGSQSTVDLPRPLRGRSDKQLLTERRKLPDSELRKKWRKRSRYSVHDSMYMLPALWLWLPKTYVLPPYSRQHVACFRRHVFPATKFPKVAEAKVY